MTTDDLTTPLGVEPAAPPAPEPERPALKPSRPQRQKAPSPFERMRALGVVPILSAAMLVVLAAVVLYVALADDPLGGQPMAVATIEEPAASASPPKPSHQGDAPAPEIALPAPSAGEPGAAGSGATVADAGGGVTLSTVQTSSGVVTVRGGLPVGAPAAGHTVVAPAEAPKPAAPKPALMEQGREGSLPRIGPDGSRPADVYARPVAIPAGLQGKNPARIAVLVGGMGISETTTADAIGRLPGAVTLAFAPYGLNLERLVGRARAAGHEIMLQSPMEPFDYPDNDPGPQTLLTGQPTDQTLDRLHWQMSRFAGYVGLTNYMGARFTADAEALKPVLADLGARGLVYADDGSSPRSQVGSLGPAANLPTTTADLVIDASPTPEAIDAALQRLEQIATTKGTAFGVAAGLPTSVKRIADWSATLERRGFVLVPVTALLKH